MKFYYYTCDLEHYGYMSFIEPKYTYEHGFVVGDQFNKGQPIATSWQPAMMEVDISQGPLSDFPLCTMGPPVLNEKAWDVLRPVLGEMVEALPVETPFGTYLALNVLDVIDCLDYEQSEFTYYPASMGGDIHRIIKCHLKPDLIKNKLMFKIPERMTRVIVSDEFKDIVVGASLKGLDFSGVDFSQVLYETERY